jgi:hypothetical protein
VSAKGQSSFNRSNVVLVLVAHSCFVLDSHGSKFRTTDRLTSPSSLKPNSGIVPNIWTRVFEIDYSLIIPCYIFSELLAALLNRPCTCMNKCDIFKIGVQIFTYIILLVLICFKQTQISYQILTALCLFAEFEFKVLSQRRILTVTELFCIIQSYHWNRNLNCKRI